MRSNKNHSPTSPNTAPATKNESHDWSISPYKTSSRMRRASGVTLQMHQILCLPRKINLIIAQRKMALMIDPPHICNVQYNALSIRSHPPTSPNTAPATKNKSHDWSTGRCLSHLPCLPGIFCSRAFIPPGLDLMILPIIWQKHGDKWCRHRISFSAGSEDGDRLRILCNNAAANNKILKDCHLSLISFISPNFENDNLHKFKCPW